MAADRSEQQSQLQSCNSCREKKPPSEFTRRKRVWKSCNSCSENRSAKGKAPGQAAGKASKQAHQTSSGKTRLDSWLQAGSDDDEEDEGGETLARGRRRGKPSVDQARVADGSAGEEDFTAEDNIQQDGEEVNGWDADDGDIAEDDTDPATLSFMAQTEPSAPSAPKLVARAGNRYGIPEGTELTARQYSVSSELWTEEKQQLLRHARDIDGLGWQEIADKHFPLRGRKAVTAQHWRMCQKDQRAEEEKKKLLAKGIAPLTDQQQRDLDSLKARRSPARWPEIKQRLGGGDADIQPWYKVIKLSFEAQGKMIKEPKATPAAAKPAAVSPLTLTNGQVALFQRLPIASRNNSGSLMPPFPQLSVSTNMSDLAQLWRDWRASQGFVSTAAGNIRTNSRVLSLAPATAVAIGDFCAHAPEDFGMAQRLPPCTFRSAQLTCEVGHKLRHADGFHGGELLFYAHDSASAMDDAAKQEWKSQSPFERYKLSGPVFGWLWKA